MRNRSMRVVGAALVILGTGYAYAADGTTAPARDPAAAEEGGAAEQVVCRRERVVGSNIKRRVCRTRADLDAQRDASQEAYRELTQPPTRSEGSS